MSKTVQASPKKEQLKFPIQKTCLRCGQIKPIQDFFLNKQWAQQDYHDKWCKECFNDLSTMSQVKNYFYDNHRQWSDNMWEQAAKRAGKALESVPAYIKSSQGRKQQMAYANAIKYMPAIMQLRYSYFDPTVNPEDFQVCSSTPPSIRKQEKIAANRNRKLTDQDQKVYSEQFNGYFTQKDLSYLNNYYNKLNEDFSFDNESLRDYAKKVCKASLHFDKAQNDYAQNKCSLADVRQAMNLFDTLSKSANFAACKRKQKDQTGVTGWAQTTYYLQTHGYLKTPNNDFEQDWIDKTINEYRATVQNLCLDLT